MVWKSDGRVKGKAVGVWSGGKKPLPESKGKPCECGLVSPTEALSQRESVGVWSGGEKRWLGQRESRGSVVWWGKAMAGSKGNALECGLARKSAA